MELMVRNCYAKSFLRKIENKKRFLLWATKNDNYSGVDSTGGSHVSQNLMARIH